MSRFANRVALADITGANLVVDGGRTSCFTVGTLGILIP
jgi:hypothetical protein